MRVPYAIITPLIVLISIIGAYALNNSMFDVFITIIFGLVGFWLRKLKYPLAPLVVALVLGDSTERTLRQALIASGGSPMTFVTSPISAALLILAALLLCYPLVAKRIAQRRPASTAASPTPAH
jgi:putative tricarboxylic transport membrane protein